MSTHRRPSASRTRFLVGVVAAALLMALGLSFLFASSAKGAAEDDAEARAARYVTTVLAPELTADEVSTDILGPDYRILLIPVQAGIMSDDRIAQIRIWAPDGDLIFSTAQRDEIENIVAQDDPQIAAAAEGETVSLVTDADVAPRSGLESTNETVLQTYVPLRLSSEVTPSAVAEIDTRYAAIEDQANEVWRPVQIALIIALGIVAVLLGLSLRVAPEVEPASVGVRPGREGALEREPERVPAGDDPRIRDAETRASAAERAARDAESRLADAERRLAAAAAVEIPPNVLQRIDDLELKFRAEAAEREQLAGEAERLRMGQSQKEQELAALRETRTENEAMLRELEDVRRRAAEADVLQGRVDEAEAALAAASLRLAEREGAASDLESKHVASTREIEDLRAHLAAVEAERDLARGDRQTVARDRDAIRVEREGLAVERDSLRGERDAVAGERDSLRVERDALTEERDGARADAERLRGELETAHSEAEVASARAQADTERLRSELEAARAEAAGDKRDLESARAAAATTAKELETLRADASASAKALERARVDAAASGKDLEKARAEVATGTDELGKVKVEVTSGRAELEKLRAAAATSAAELEKVKAGASSATAELERQRSEVTAELEHQRSEATAELERQRSEATARSKELEQTKADAATTKAELDRSRADFERLRSELDEMAAEVQRITTEVPAPASTPASEERLGELEGRVRELEERRRADVEELRGAQESLANTQVELVDATRKLKEAQAKIRDLEREVAEASLAAERVAAERVAAEPEPSREPAYASSTFQDPGETDTSGPMEGSMSSFAARISSLRREITSHVEEVAGVASGNGEDGEEVLSLRERLARAAAARHRPSDPE